MTIFFRIVGACNIYRKKILVELVTLKSLVLLEYLLLHFWLEVHAGSLLFYVVKVYIYYSIKNLISVATTASSYTHLNI